MDEALILYCVFMWLLTIGIIGGNIERDKREWSASEIAGATINLIFAPLITPILIGYLISD